MECTGHSHDHNHHDDQGVSLFPEIDIPQVYCLNEHDANACRGVLKKYEDRFEIQPTLQSQRCDDPYDDSDDERPELLLHVPFTEAVAIQSISIGGIARIFQNRQNEGEERELETTATSAPLTVKIFADRLDLDFEIASELASDCTIELVSPEHALEGTSLDYPLRPAGKFRNCTSVTLYFGDNFAYSLHDSEGSTRGEGTFINIPTEITYVGFKGRGTRVKRKIVEAVYETRGMKKDHKVPGGDFGASHGVS